MNSIVIFKHKKVCDLTSFLKEKIMSFSFTRHHSSFHLDVISCIDRAKWASNKDFPSLVSM
jgi:hypothetical protein